ncbi:uncharacterized protein LOC142236338 [Haematobia irritans]|uniref:uncharacterized protein LOC142236338 n=1 Tax=Haematobia irritans TaxID=7368 RepID=UPI003F4FC436
MKKIQTEHRPFCRPQRRQKIINRPTADSLCHKGLMSGQTKPRPLVDCPFYNLNYNFDELPLDPVKEFIVEKISHMQSDTITGRCNKELEFHRYEMDKINTEYMTCEDDVVSTIQLEDIKMPDKFEMLRDRNEHFYGFLDSDEGYPWLKKISGCCVNSYLGHCIYMGPISVQLESRKPEKNVGLYGQLYESGSILTNIGIHS